MTKKPITMPIVVDGYVRLSRDDNKRNYSSIENQKLIISEYAKMNHMIIREIYEDDGISGYSFNRPEFQRMMANINNIDIIIAKDLSRIGRHNAKVLLFLEEMEELGKQVILIDDNYDSFVSDDDIIGIKTWDNERHVKSTSRKVKRVKRLEQEKGTLITAPPFGYVRHALNKRLFEIDEESASIVRLIFELYLNGYGIRKLSDELNNRGVPTASMLQKKRCEEAGVVYRKTLATKWNFSMVKDIIINDFYLGIFRTHKRERKKINGREVKVKKEDQFVFYQHHEAIIPEEQFYQVQETLNKRKKIGYRGQKKYVNLFAGVLFCKDCNSRLTAINRESRSKYYICGTYNKKGKQFCSHSHVVNEEVLTSIIIKYLTLCRDSLIEIIRDFDITKLKNNRFSENDGKVHLERELETAKGELQILVKQKIEEITRNPTMQGILTETYDCLQNDKLSRIASIEKTLKELIMEPKVPATSIKPCLNSALDILNDIILQKKLTMRDVETLIDKIIVDKDGSVEVYLNHGLGNLAKYDIAEDQHNDKLRIMVSIIELLEKSLTGFTSVKYLADTLRAMNYPMHKKKFVPYMKSLLELGIVEPHDHHHKPYKIVASKAQLDEVKKMFIMLGQTGGMPQMVFEYILKKQGINPATDLEILQNIDFGSTSQAFAGGTGDYTVEFEPAATGLESQDKGKVVASLGVDSGKVPYTAYSAKQSYIEKNPKVIQGFTNAIQKGMDYVNTHSPEEIAKTIQPQFKETDLETITKIVTRYYEQETWKNDLIFEEESFELLQDILIEAGELDEKVPYTALVNTKFATEAIHK